MPIFYTLRELQDKLNVLDPLPVRPVAPAKVTALGLKLAARIQWSRVEGVSGYRVAVMSTNNLHQPNELSPLLDGDETLSYVWYAGDVAVARQFTVQSFKRAANGEILFSDFTRPFVSATTKVDGGVADSAPTAAPSAPVSPATGGTVGDPGGIHSPAEREISL